MALPIPTKIYAQDQAARSLSFWSLADLYGVQRRFNDLGKIVRRKAGIYRLTVDANVQFEDAVKRVESGL